MQSETSLIKPYGYVYKITNKVNGKCYIGQSTNVGMRFYRYKRMECKKQTKLYRAFVKYGIDSFSFNIIDMGIDKLKLDELEIHHIKLYNCIDDGYNCSCGGSSGGKHSTETKRKISESQRGRIVSEESRRRMSEAWKGRIVTEETRRKMSNANKGKHRSDITNKRMAEARKGYTITEEHKRKISEANKGKINSEEHNRKISEAQKGKIIPEETRKRMSESAQHRKCKISEETRKRMSESRKGEKHYLYGKHISKETKAKMVESRRITRIKKDAPLIVVKQ